MSINQNQNIKNALCYIPIVAIIIFFIEENKNDNLKTHIRYGIILFLLYIVLSTLISILFFGFAFFFNFLLLFSYIGLSIFLGFKVYSGEEFKLNFLDNIESKVKDIFK